MNDINNTITETNLTHSYAFIEGANVPDIMKRNINIIWKIFFLKENNLQFSFISILKKNFQYFFDVFFKRTVLFIFTYTLWK